jgi:RHS repeat-associated protein
MGMEDIDYAPGGAVSKITDYGIGARGIDGIYVTQNGSTTANYPIYDAHGNMISTLSRQGTGYATAALRTFDAWGQIRVGAQTGDPKGRYCASLGHKQDDESGLVYMRARYYEPTSGRFVSEDPSMEGRNWVVYCNDDPVNCVDGTGRGPEWIVMVFEFLRELGHAAHDPSGPNIFKIVLKTANGWQEAKLSLWSIKTIQGLYKTMMSGLEAEEATGEGATIGAWLTVMDFAYSVALVLAIDGIDFYGGNAAIDALFSEGGK